MANALLNDIHDADPKPTKKLDKSNNSSSEMKYRLMDLMLYPDLYDGAKVLYNLMSEAFDIKGKPFFDRDGNFNVESINPELLNESEEEKEDYTQTDLEIIKKAKKLLNPDSSEVYASSILLAFSISPELDFSRNPKLKSKPMNTKKPRLVNVIAMDSEDQTTFLRTVNHCLFLKTNRENLNFDGIKKENLEKLRPLMKDAVRQYEIGHFNKDVKGGFDSYFVNSFISLVNQNFTSDKLKFTIKTIPIPKEQQVPERAKQMQMGQNAIQKAFQAFRFGGIKGALTSLATGAINKALGESITDVALDLERFIEAELPKLTEKTFEEVKKAVDENGNPKYPQFNEFKNLEELEKAFKDGTRINPDESYDEPKPTNNMSGLDLRDSNFIKAFASKPGNNCDGVAFKEYLISIINNPKNFLETLSRQTYLKSGYKMDLSEWDKKQNYLISDDWKAFENFIGSMESNARVIDDNNKEIYDTNRRLSNIDVIIKAISEKKQSAPKDKYGNDMINIPAFEEKYPVFQNKETVLNFVSLIANATETVINLGNYNPERISVNVPDNIKKVFQTILADFNRQYDNNRLNIYQHIWILLENKNTSLKESISDIATNMYSYLRRNYPLTHL